MEQTGEALIQATQLEVWNALHDATILKECLDGCELMELTGDNEYRAVVAAKVGPVRTKFNAIVKVENEIRPESYTLVVEVKGGAAGFGKGVADVSLSTIGDATQLSYLVRGNVGGKLAQIGSRLVVIASRKMADKFFANFAKLWVST